jgi:hypothetical protein
MLRSHMLELERPSITSSRSIFAWLALASVAVGIYFLIFKFDLGLSLLFTWTAYMLFAVDGRRKKPSELPSLFPR